MSNPERIFKIIEILKKKSEGSRKELIQSLGEHYLRNGNFSEKQWTIIISMASRIKYEDEQLSVVESDLEHFLDDQTLTRSIRMV